MATRDFVSLATGVRLEYVEQGPSGALPVIFLHGVTDSWRSFERVLSHLPPEIHAMAISQRGHGDSSRPDSGYRFVDMAQDLEAFLDAFHIPRAVIVGHSMGASVAQQFVVDHSDRTAALVLMGSFTTYHDPTLLEFYETTIAPLTDPIAAAFAREWQLSTLAREMPADALETVVNETLKVPARVWREAFLGFLQAPDVTDSLRTVSVPALILWGDRDTYALGPAQDRLRSVLPHAAFIVYEGAGHAFHWEDPARTAADLAEFLAKPRTPPSAA